MSRESTKARRSARRRVFVADPPLASLVDEAVAQLKIHRQYRLTGAAIAAFFSLFGLAIGSPGVTSSSVRGRGSRSRSRL